MKIIARIAEQQMLERLLKSSKPEFIAVYGRRRVGKTYLIRNFFEFKGLFFQITGVAGGRLSHQLYHFNQEIENVFGVKDSKKTSTWQESFNQLCSLVNSAGSQRKIILFFDELPWLAGKRSGFIEAFTYAWNRHLSNNPSVIVVICGSAASWMIKNVIDSKGGLYNRVTGQLRLEPFTLHDTELYLKEKLVELDRRQIIELYMAFGGIPAYLDLIRQGRSSAQIISEVCLSQLPNSLYGEFERSYKALFADPTHHLKIIQALFQVKSGLTREEIIAVTGILSGSLQERVFRELEECSIISGTHAYKSLRKNNVYRLTDEYSLFYLHWQKKILAARGAAAPEYWLTLQKTPAWYAWAGGAFEAICFKHRAGIARALGIAGIQYDIGSFRAKGNELSGEKGVQIDMVIDRSDKCINLCEIKFSPDVLVVTKDLADELERKKAAFQKALKTKATVFVTLITVHGAEENNHYRRVVQNQVTAQDLFTE